jgi:hypothetical protein
MMVWGEEFEKFGKQFAKGQVVEITAKIEKDQRNDNLQLVCQGLKPMPAPKAAQFGEGDTSSGASAVSSRVNEPVRPDVRPLLLLLDSTRDSTSDLAHIQELVSRYPGDVPLHLRIRTERGSVDLEAGARFCVTLDDTLLQELAPWS